MQRNLTNLKIKRCTARRPGRCDLWPSPITHANPHLCWHLLS